MDRIHEINIKINKLKNELQTGATDIKKKSVNVLNNHKQYLDFVEGFDASNSVNQFVQKMNNIGKGLEKILKGIFVDEVQALGKGLDIGFHNIGEFLYWTSEFLFSYLSCGIQYIENIHRCIFFYLLDAFAKLFYFPVTFILWISWEWGGNDLYKTHDEIWNVIYYIDDEFYKTFGFHFAHYSKNITDSCYNCKRLKIVALKSKSSQINYDFETKIPELLQSGMQEILDGAKIMG
jgi:hypothetical protein